MKVNNVVAIIPARGGSKRLLRKNIYPVCGNPMIYYAIRACQNAKFINHVYVSTEDEEIKKVARTYGAGVIDRPQELAEDDVWTQPVIEHAIKELEKHGMNIDYVLWVGANSPLIEATKLDEAVEKILKQKHKLYEVLSMNLEGYEDGAFRVLRRDTAFQKALSVYVGIVTTHYIDVHTREDVKEIEARYCDKLRDR